MNAEISDHNVPTSVRATFANSDQMQNAVSKLSVSGFDRADLSTPTQEPRSEGTTLGAESKPASTDDDAQQLRTLGASTAASVAAMAAAGITVATGGAAIPVIAAAVAAGGAAGGGVFALHGAADKAEQNSRNERAAAGTLYLTVRTATVAKHAEAEAILRSAGATAIENLT